MQSSRALSPVTGNGQNIYNPQSTQYCIIMSATSPAINELNAAHYATPGQRRRRRYPSPKAVAANSSSRGNAKPMPLPYIAMLPTIHAATPAPAS